MSAADVRTIRGLEPKRELFIRRANEASVVTLAVDPESRWLYTSDPVEAVRREKAIARWGLEGALMRLAAGVDEGRGGGEGGNGVMRVMRTGTAVLVFCLGVGLADRAVGQTAQSGDGAPGIGGVGTDDGRTPIRTVQGSETQPVRIWTRVRTVTTIVLPEGESVVETASGDAENWDVNPAGGVLYLKPLVVGLVSNLTVRSASGRVFTFTVVEDGNAVTDYVVTVEVEDGELVPELEDAARALVPTVFRAAGIVEGHDERMAAFDADRPGDHRVLGARRRGGLGAGGSAAGGVPARLRAAGAAAVPAHRGGVRRAVPGAGHVDGRAVHLSPVRGAGAAGVVQLPGGRAGAGGGGHRAAGADGGGPGAAARGPVPGRPGGVLRAGVRGGVMPQERPGWWRRQFGEAPRMFWTWGLILGGFVVLAQ